MLDKALAIRDKIIEIRRVIHANPELSFQEFATARLAAAFLDELGYQVREHVGKTGIVADRGAGSTVAIRADMDALPIQEENEIEHRSRVAGVMHACGHDAHVACALGAAVLLAQENLNGRIRILLQPAEETGDEDSKSGAARMIEDGAMDGVDAVLGLHVSASLPAGAIGIRPGPIMAASDSFHLKIIGHAAHGARPQDGVDAVALAAQVINAIHQIVSRRISPLAPGVITIGTIQGSSARANIISQSVDMTGTIRSFDEKLRKLLHQELRHACEMSKALGGSYELTIKQGCPVTINDPKLAELVHSTAIDLLGEDKVIIVEPDMGSEDFALLAQQAPGCYFWLGAAIKDDPRHHHSPRFDIDESALHIGAAMFAEVSKRILGWKSEAAEKGKLDDFMAFRQSRKKPE